jgi:hypothetical protein
MAPPMHIYRRADLASERIESASVARAGRSIGTLGR